MEITFCKFCLVHTLPITFHLCESCETVIKMDVSIDFDAFICFSVIELENVA